jgi:hypothetical protein
MCMVTPPINLFVLHLQVPSSAQLGHWHHATTNVDSAAPRPMSPRQCHCQHDSALTSCCRQIALTAPLPAWLGGLVCTFPTSNLTRRFTSDQTPKLEEYYSDWQPDSGTLLPILLTSTRGERVVTTMLWGISLNQLSHFLSCILFRVNISIYF